MKGPLVSVVCLCYNHGRFIKEAIQSVKDQDYTPIELVIVDDHSTDNSASIIRELVSGSSTTRLMELPENIGNCAAFNKGLTLTKGEFIIDLSGDDILLKDRISKGIAAFENASSKTGVNFTDAQIIDEDGKVTGLHSDKFPHSIIPQGDIYKEIISRYFINSPTMMVRRDVLDALGGYDESLAYEDFDFWVRSSRIFEYCYTPEALVRRRVVSNSLGQRQFQKGSPQLRSTLRVCEKAIYLNRTSEEKSALRKRIMYEMRRALRLGDWRIAKDYFKLMRKL